jgi:poly-gamma-glutamate synthesis protein (capsule biosynthesis protein)
MTLTPTPEQPVQVTLAAVGDIMLGRKVNLKMVEYADYTWPFHDVAPLIREADLAVGNLESMFYDRCEPTAERMVFCADPAALEGLVYAGFDGLSLANNHHLDYGEDAFRQTVALLEEGGITPFYHDEVMIAEVRGVRIGVIGLDDKLEWLKPEEIAPLIEAAAAQVDVLVGFMHWGQEYWSEADLRQQYLAPALVEAGMDVVIGSHPHVVQPVVIYGDAPVFLSLGNFVFDQRQPEAARRGDILLLTLTVEDGELAGIDYELIPVMIHDYGQPRLTEGE